MIGCVLTGFVGRMCLLGLFIAAWGEGEAWAHRLCRMLPFPYCKGLKTLGQSYLCWWCG